MDTETPPPHPPPPVPPPTSLPPPVLPPSSSCACSAPQARTWGASTRQIHACACRIGAYGEHARLVQTRVRLVRLARQREGKRGAGAPRAEGGGGRGATLSATSGALPDVPRATLTPAAHRAHAQAHAHQQRAGAAREWGDGGEGGAAHTSERSLSCTPTGPNGAEFVASLTCRRRRAGTLSAHCARKHAQNAPSSRGRGAAPVRRRRRAGRAAGRACTRISTSERPWIPALAPLYMFLAAFMAPRRKKAKRCALRSQINVVRTKRTYRRPRLPWGPGTNKSQPT